MVKKIKKSIRKKSKRNQLNKRKSSSASFRKKLNKIKKKLFEKIGAFTVFFVILFVLLSILFFLWMNQYSHNYQKETESQELALKQEAFINELAPIAQRLQEEYGILSSVSLAQAALESNFGQSQLSSDYFNLYGVKTDANDPQGVDFDTLEYIDGEWLEISDYFKVYPSWEASMEGHAQLIYFGTSWDENYYQEVLEATTYQEQAQGLQEAGYATDPTYGKKLIEMIENYKLDKYDTLARTVN